MIALFFEVLPRAGHETTYLDMAARLKPALDASGGLVFLDRSRSQTRPGWMLSHQFWQDEASMVRWRCHGAHHRAQACGRADVLADYRLRVAQVIASVSADEPLREMPVPSYARYDGSGGVERVIVSVLSHGPDGIAAGALFASVYDPNLTVTVAEARSIDEGRAFLAQAAALPGLRAARLGLVSRGYGMFDRVEAPQYFEPVTVA
jgi:heme-degrading monooxygenase HmoA